MVYSCNHIVEIEYAFTEGNSLASTQKEINSGTGVEIIIEFGNRYTLPRLTVAAEPWASLLRITLDGESEVLSSAFMT